MAARGTRAATSDTRHRISRFPIPWGGGKPPARTPPGLERGRLHRRREFSKCYTGGQTIDRPGRYQSRYRPPTAADRQRSSQRCCSLREYRRRGVKLTPCGSSRGAFSLSPARRTTAAGSGEPSLVHEQPQKQDDHNYDSNAVDAVTERICDANLPPTQGHNVRQIMTAPT